MFEEILKIFVVYGTLGWVIDTVYRSIEERCYSEASTLCAPVLPVYGFGALFIWFSYSWIPNHTGLQLIFYAISLGAIEYLAGVFTERVFGRRYWDYSDQPYNLHGHTDLWHAVLWGISAVAFIELVHPFVQSWI